MTTNPGNMPAIQTIAFDGSVSSPSKRNICCVAQHCPIFLKRNVDMALHEVKSSQR